jgi:hypothetical protein
MIRISVLLNIINLSNIQIWLLKRKLIKFYVVSNYFSFILLNLRNCLQVRLIIVLRMMGLLLLSCNIQNLLLLTF